MYYQDDQEQLTMEEFFQPFGGRLRKDNRWVRLAAILPWEHIEKVYIQNLSKETGRPAIPFRIAFGAIFIKEFCHHTDEGTVQELQENSYMQYFVGLHEFQAEALFDPSMMVHFRKRFPVEEVAKINEYVCTGKWPEEQRNVDRNDKGDEPLVPFSGDGGRGGKASRQKGKANPNTSKKRTPKKESWKTAFGRHGGSRQHQVSHRYRPAEQKPGASGNGGEHSLVACGAYRPYAVFSKKGPEVLPEAGQKQEMDSGKMSQGDW